MTKFIRAKVSRVDRHVVNNLEEDMWFNTNHIIYVCEETHTKWDGSYSDFPTIVVSTEAFAGVFAVHDKTIQEIVSELKTP